MGSNILNKEQILAADDLKREEVDTPEWGGSVLIRMMDEVAGQEFELFCYNDGKGQNLEGMRLKMCLLCMINEDGSKMFSEDDIALLAAKSHAEIVKVSEAALRLNRLTKEELGALEGN